MYLSCLQLNELGDAFAGIFAPAAFVALAISVYLQNREIAHTQINIEKQIRLTEEQLLETRKSTEYINIQMTALKEEQKIRRREQSNRDFIATIEAFQMFLIDVGKITLWAKNEKNDSWSIYNIPTIKPDDKQFSAIVGAWLMDVRAVILNAKDPHVKTVSFKINKEAIDHIIKYINNIEGYLPTVSGDMVIRYQTYNLGLLREKLLELIECTPHIDT